MTVVRISVDTDVCVGAGQCVLAAAEVFDQRESDGVVLLLRPEPPATACDAVRDAATNCPSGAIRVEW